MPFERHLPSIAPPWLARTVGRAYFQRVGRLMDSVVSRLRDASKARFPTRAAADGFEASDALDAIGVDRQLPRASAEDDISYALRLLDAWTTWGGDNRPLVGIGGGAGSHLGMLKALALLSLPIGPSGVTIVQQNGRYSQLSTAGALVLGSLMNCINRVDLTGSAVPRPGWTFEGRDWFYSEFGLVLPADVPELTVGSVLATEVHMVVGKWKPGKARFIGTWILQSGLTLGWPTGRALGTDPNLGGNVIRYIPPPGGNGIGYQP